MRFTKMHGAGNDYVYVNAFEERLHTIEAAQRGVGDAGELRTARRAAWLTETHAADGCDPLEITALDRVASAGESIDIHASAAVLRQSLINADGHAPGVVFQRALLAGQRLDRCAARTGIGSPSGQFSLLLGDRAGARRQERP